MMHKFKFYLWLIDLLSIEPLPLEEIKIRWKFASANDSHLDFSERTFNRYRREAELLMYVEIVCDKKNGNVYRIVRPDGFKNNELREWLHSAFRISNLASSVNQRKDILIESAPAGACLLQNILEAIDRKRMLSLTYKSHYKESQTLQFVPAFVRLFKQRWYVIGENRENKKCVTLAFERISNPVMGEEPVVFSETCSILRNPETYFEHCYGIIRQHDPILIRFRAFWPEDAYLQDVKIHTSQTEIYKTEHYTDFEIYVRPTYDLKQEFLWHRDKLAVLSPESFKNEMIQIIRATLAGYETGKEHAIDE